MAALETVSAGVSLQSLLLSAAPLLPPASPPRFLVLCSAAADVKVPPTSWQPSATGGAGRDRHQGQVQLVEAWTHCSNSSFKDEMTGLVSTDPGRDFMLGRPQAGWTPSLSSTIS